MKKMVKHNALKMMTKALNTWRNMVNSKKNENYETYVKNGWPQIQEKDWWLFVAS
jgi:beta-lactamase class D